MDRVKTTLTAIVLVAACSALPGYDAGTTDAHHFLAKDDCVVDPAPRVMTVPPDFGTEAHFHFYTDFHSVGWNTGQGSSFVIRNWLRARTDLLVLGVAGVVDEATPDLPQDATLVVELHYADHPSFAESVLVAQGRYMLEGVSAFRADTDWKLFSGSVPADSWVGVRVTNPDDGFWDFNWKYLAVSVDLAYVTITP